MIRTALVFMVISGLFAPALAVEQELEDRIQKFATTQLSKWLDNPELVKAIKTQNQEHVGLSQSEIDDLDEIWRKEFDEIDQPMIDELLSRSTSEYLRGMQFSRLMTAVVHIRSKLP